MRYCFSRSLAARQLIRRRLALVLLVALSVFGLSWVSEARAEAPVVSYYITATSYGTFNSYAEACTFTVMKAIDSRTISVTGVSDVNATPVFCRYKYDAAGVPNDGSRVITKSTLCSNGATPDTTKPLDQQCPLNCSGSGTLNKYRGSGVTGPSLTETAPSLICVQGCGYAGGAVMVTFPKAGGGYTYSGRLGAATGQACTTANYDVIDTVMYNETDDKPASPLSCADKGKVYGTVNGVGICANAGTIPGSTVQTNETKTSTETSASGVQANPQTETTTYSVGNINGVGFVTSTVTHSDGSKSQVTQTQDGFCRDNPNSSPCGGGGGGGGGGKEDKGIAGGGDDCQAQPVCSGDAIQCMMVKQQWYTRCDSNKPNDQSALGAQILAGNDPVKNPANADQRTVRNISSSIDQTAFLSGGGGLVDKVVTVHGNAITLPFSKLNQYLLWLGHIFVVISLIGGLRIVLGGFK